MTRFTPQWLQAGSYAASIDRRLIGALWPAAASSGMAVTVSSAMTLNVAAGQCAVPSANNTGTLLCSSDAVEQVTLGAAPASGSNRIDLVCVQVRGTDLDGGTDNDWILSVVAGTVAASPVAPAVPANAVALAQVYVGGGVASIVAGNITDRRPGNLAIGAIPASYPRGFLVSATGPSGTVNVTATWTTVFSLSVPVLVGRRYRINAWGRGLQGTATGTNQQMQIADDQTGTATLGLNQNLAVGNTLLGQGSHLYVPTSTKTAVINFQAFGGGGNLQFVANVATIWAEDIGTG